MKLKVPTTAKLRPLRRGPHGPPVPETDDGCTSLSSCTGLLLSASATCAGAVGHCRGSGDMVERMSQCEELEDFAATLVPPAQTAGSGLIAVLVKRGERDCGAAWLLVAERALCRKEAPEAEGRSRGS